MIKEIIKWVVSEAVTKTSFYHAMQTWWLWRLFYNDDNLNTMEKQVILAKLPYIDSHFEASYKKCIIYPIQTYGLRVSK